MPWKSFLMANRFTYYGGSIITLIKGVKNISALLQLATREPSDSPIEIRLRNGECFRISTLMDAWILKETVLDRQYENVSVVLQPNWLVIDIGAALGDYAVWAAQQLTTGRLIAVEPFPRSVKLLCDNLKLNHVENVEVVETAIGEKDGQLSLQLVTGQAVQHSTAATSASAGSLPVSVHSLESFFAQMKIDSCDYLKLDCEGAEYDILFNCSKDILKKIARICMEVHDRVTPHSRDEMIEFLERNGYITRLTLNPVHNELAYLYAEK
jgi:FkbM family methyltransferase